MGCSVAGAPAGAMSVGSLMFSGAAGSVFSGAGAAVGSAAPGCAASGSPAFSGAAGTGSRGFGVGSGCGIFAFTNCTSAGCGTSESVS